jgi:hypothetical protein
MRMPTHYYERFEGPIRGLRLPLAAWNSLHDEGITTLDQLKAVRLERLVGIGPKLAQVIRDELARLAAEQPSDQA